MTRPAAVSDLRQVSGLTGRERKSLERWIGAGRRGSLPTDVFASHPQDRPRLLRFLRGEPDWNFTPEDAERHVRAVEQRLAGRRSAMSATQFGSDADRADAMAEILNERAKPKPRAHKPFSWANGGRRAIAHHEAGHAVALYCEGAQLTGAVLNLSGRGNFLGKTCVADGTRWSAVVEHAGIVAEDIAAGVREGREDDFEDHSARVTDMAARDVGFSSREIRNRAKAYREDAETLVREHWPAISAVASALEARGTLNRSQLLGILRGNLPPAVVAAVETDRARRAKHGGR